MLPDLEIAVRLLVAATLGSLIGFERERLLWAAGGGDSDSYACLRRRLSCHDCVCLRV
jgi:hypothetical protein